MISERRPPPIDHVSSPVGDAITSTAAAVFAMAGIVVYAAGP